jgi:uncharacterized protein YlxW (UPF0749 family)
MNDWSSLNDTLEEQLRRELIDLNKENNDLRNRIEMLEKIVAQEQKDKYEAYKRISTLVSKTKLAHNEQT